MITNHSSSLDSFFRTGQNKRFFAGEVILSGEEPTGVFYIQSGFVKVYSISDSGDKYVHIIYRPGEIFPLIWALRDVLRRVFYEAASDISVLQVSKSDFLAYLKNNSEVIREVLDQTVEQFSVYADRLDNLQYRSAHERLVYRLLFLASRFGVKRGNKTIIKAPITHESVAESINLARETVSREIELLEKKHLIGREGGNIVIYDVKKLSNQFSSPVSLDLWGLKPS